MIPALLITLRETLEAALVVSIILGYLNKTQQYQYKKYVWTGIVSAVLTSMLGAWGFVRIAGGFEGRAEQIFEGVVMLVGAALLTTMIIWMMNQRGRIQALKERLSHTVENAKRAEIFALVFFSVLREGIETVIFLNTVLIAMNGGGIVGALLGILIALVLGYALYKGALKMNIKKFFTITSGLLILFAAGLVAHGVHELQEAGIIPVIVEHLWDMNHFIYEDGAFGQLLKGLFGYNGNPSFLEVVAYACYFMLVGVLYIKRT